MNQCSDLCRRFPTGSLHHASKTSQNKAFELQMKKYQSKDLVQKFKISFTKNILSDEVKYYWAVITVGVVDSTGTVVVVGHKLCRCCDHLWFWGWVASYSLFQKIENILSKLQKLRKSFWYRFFFIFRKQ